MSLKLVEAGVPKERLGLLAVPMIPVQIALPLIIAKYTSGKCRFQSHKISGNSNFFLKYFKPNFAQFHPTIFWKIFK